ncbi:MAG: beta strand repeat-containing protein [Candidatus Dormibacteria bacterium]
MRILTNPRGSWARYRGSVRLPRLGVGLVATAGVLALGLAAIGPVSAHTTQLSNATSSVGGAYTAMTPMRLLDTRTTGQTLGAGSSLNLPVVTAADGVPSNATAVALNVTVTNTTDASYLAAYPTGGTKPYVSNLNWVMGETVPNSVIVPVGTGGSVTFYNHTGSADVVVDLEGYFAPESGGSTAGAYVPLTPARIADTRTASGYPNAGSTLAAGGSVNIQVAGAGGVPAGATGAILNVTVTNTTAASYAEVYPTGATQPTASNLNWTAGETVANRVLAPLSSTGMVTVYNHTGSADVVVDVSGYFTNGTATLPANASLYTAITPIRLVDTRVSGGTLSAGGTDTAQVSGMGGVSSTATAAVLNVTAANTTASSFFTVFPSGAVMPVASDVNWSAGQVVPNLTVATLSGSGAISVYNHAGSAALIIDAFGYFGPFTSPPITLANNATGGSLSENASGSVANYATITAKVTNPTGSAATAVSVSFSDNGAAGCGVFSTSGGSSFTTKGSTVTVGPTNFSSGVATVTAYYAAGTAAGPCVITGQELNYGSTATTTVTTSAATNSVAITGTASIAGNGTSQDTLTATVSGATANSDKVTFTDAGTCGTLSITSATTPATGTASVQSVYTASNASGFCTVTATEANTGQSNTFVIDQTSGSGVAVALSPVTYPSSGTVVANGVNNYVITVTTTNGSFAFPNDQVMLSENSAANCGTLSSNVVTTNGSGTATVTYTTPAQAAGTAANSCVISAKEAASGSVSGSSSSTVNQIGPSNANTVAVSPSTMSVVAGSGSNSSAVVTVTNTSGTAVSGDGVSWSTGGSTCGTITPAGSTATNGSGQVSYNYAAPAVADAGTACTITFTEAGTSSTGTLTVDNIY